METENKKVYDVKCVACDHEFYASKSMAQEIFGWNDKGSGSCPRCKTYLNLTFNEEEQRFISMEWNLYLERNGIFTDKEKRNGES